MKKILLLTLVFIFSISQYTYSQTCQAKVNGGGDYNFLGGCETGTTGDNFTYAGNYTIDIENKTNLVINGNITFDETLTINLNGGDATITIMSPYTLRAKNLVINGTPGGGTTKVLDVKGPDGALVVDETVNFTGKDVEIDGGGSITANRIEGAENTTCEGDNNCPTFNVDDCDGTGDSLCGEEALPIELKTFSASKSGTNISLDWVTAKEENFSHFEVERSLDQENWEQIGLVQGMGESMSDVNYDFTDRNAPFGVIYYRLKAVDIDATFEYSPVVKIEVGFEGKLAVSPNPVKDASNLKVQVPKEFREDLAYVGLFDLSGVKVQEFRNFDTDGSLQINQKLKSGMYILKVNHNGLQENIRIIIQ
ncbi:MAG: T9SS type A sorting domain-containing protein [Bacteroidota bacterium]